MELIDLDLNDDDIFDQSEARLKWRETHSDTVSEWVSDRDLDIMTTAARQAVPVKILCKCRVHENILVQKIRKLESLFGADSIEQKICRVCNSVPMCF